MKRSSVQETMGFKSISLNNSSFTHHDFIITFTNYRNTKKRKSECSKQGQINEDVAIFVGSSYVDYEIYDNILLTKTILFLFDNKFFFC